MSYQELRDRRRRLLADAIRKQRWAKLELPDGPALGLAPLHVGEKDVVSFFEGAIEATKKHGTSIDIKPSKIKYIPTKSRRLPSVRVWPKNIQNIVNAITKATGQVPRSLTAHLVDGNKEFRERLGTRPILVMGATREFIFTDKEKEVAVADPNDHPSIRGRTLQPFIVSNTVEGRKALIRGKGGRTLIVVVNS